MSNTSVEFTFRSLVLAILLTILLATANSYLALKLGLLTSASIPAAMLSMGVLRFFKNSSILENNLVQTAASSGEAIAGGIVYTIPALIIIGFWHKFDFWSNFWIAFIGGSLGVLFSVPLRRLLVHDERLAFPEGRAIAEVLKSSSEKIGLRYLVYGGALGALFEFCQGGLKILSSSISYWFAINRTIVGFGVGFSTAMIGAGYLMGSNMSISIFVGAIIAWCIALPISSNFYPEFLLKHSVTDAGVLLWGEKMRYLGIGAMLLAGVITAITLLKPFIINLRESLADRKNHKGANNPAEVDMPGNILIGGVVFLSIALFVLFSKLFPFAELGMDMSINSYVVIAVIAFTLIIGFLFSVMTSYFSGMVGVTATPGSALVIAGVLLAAWLLLSLMKMVVKIPIQASNLHAAEATVIIIGGILTGIAAIANDNTQDLKVGHLVGATPWKQQLMLLLGVLVSSLIIPPVMQLLFDVYGIAGVMPCAGMDISQSLPAPTAALMSTISQGVFRNTLPWNMIMVGCLIILVIIIFNKIFKFEQLRLSSLGIAMGMYLPMTSSFPLLIGGVIALMAEWELQRQNLPKQQKNRQQQRGTLITCGLVAGAAIMDVFLAIPFSIYQDPNVLSLVTPGWANYAIILSVLTTTLLAIWIWRVVGRQQA